MFERYTEKARRVIFFGRYEANAAGAKKIGTEHLLLGILRSDPELVPRLLGGELTEMLLREAVLQTTPARDPASSSKDLQLSNECKRVLAYSAEEAERFGSRLIGSGHMLLGLMREKDCAAERLLRQFGGDLEKMRKGVAVEPSETWRAEGGGAPSIHSAYEHVRKITGWDGPDSTKTGFGFYTEKARRAVFFARLEASQLGAGKMEPEHLLLGLWRDAAFELNELMGRTDAWPDLREKIAARMPLTTIATSAEMELSDGLKEVFDLAAEEARGMNSQVGVGHLTLGLLRREGCFAGQLLRERGAEVERIRSAVRERVE